MFHVSDVYKVDILYLPTIYLFIEKIHVLSQMYIAIVYISEQILDDDDNNIYDVGNIPCSFKNNMLNEY